MSFVLGAHTALRQCYPCLALLEPNTAAVQGPSLQHIHHTLKLVLCQLKGPAEVACLAEAENVGARGIDKAAGDAARTPLQPACTALSWRSTIL